MKNESAPMCKQQINRYPVQGTEANVPKRWDYDFDMRVLDDFGSVYSFSHNGHDHLVGKGAANAGRCSGAFCPGALAPVRGSWLTAPDFRLYNEMAGALPPGLEDSELCIPLKSRIEPPCRPRRHLVAAGVPCVRHNPNITLQSKAMVAQYHIAFSQNPLSACFRHSPPVDKGIGH